MASADSSQIALLAADMAMQEIAPTSHDVRSAGVDAKDARNGDPNDQISEAIPADPSSVVWAIADQIDANDVDMYSVLVEQGQRVAFDVDSTTRIGFFSLFQGTIRLFDGDGQQLAMDSMSEGPREGFGEDEGYLEYTFAAAGTFYVGLSGVGNETYSPTTGDGDAPSDEGEYTFTITKVTSGLQHVAGRNAIDGLLAMPNPEDHRLTVPVSVERVGGAGQAGLPIERDLPTWLVIHGRVDNPNQFRPLAGALSQFAVSGQVLVLDWSAGAADNTDLVGLDGAEWIPYVGHWAAGVLKNLGVMAAETVVIGHSWGSYAAYETAQSMGQVAGLVALDPARAATGYPYESVDFGAVAQQSWAFYGTGTFGSQSLSATATAAFFTEYGAAEVDSFERHRAPIHIFETIVVDHARGRITLPSLFPLASLMSPPASSPWRTDAYSPDNSLGSLQAFEGGFTVAGQPDASRLGGIFWRPSSFRYIDDVLGGEVVVLTDDNTRLVQKLYQQVLQRLPDQAGLIYWTQRLASGEAPGVIAEGIFESDERLNPIVSQYYRDFLLREVEAAGLAYWRDQVWKRDGGPENVISGMIGSPEFFQSAGGTNRAWVTELYRRLLEREPEPSGLQFWTDSLDSQDSTRENVVLGFVQSLENFRNLIGFWFQQYLDRSPDGGESESFVGLMSGGASHREIQLMLINSQEYRDAV